MQHEPKVVIFWAVVAAIIAYCYFEFFSWILR